MQPKELEIDLGLEICVKFNQAERKNIDYSNGRRAWIKAGGGKW